MERSEIIAAILENLILTKRAMVTHLHDTIAGSALSHAQLELLYIIAQQQPLTAKALAERRQLTPGAISQLVEALSSEGLVRRESAENDRRVQLLRTTAKGDKTLRIVEQRRNELFQGLMLGLSDKELATWLHIQRKVIAGLEHHKTHDS